MANLEFTEYVASKPVYGAQTGLLRGQESATQQVAIGATSAASSAFGASTNVIEISAVAADCRIAIGAPATVAAVNSGTFSRRLNTGHTYRFAVEPGQALAVIAIEGGADVDDAPASAGMATAANQTAEATLIGGVTETAPASDTASSGLNGRLQRIAQRVTSLIALLPASLGAKTMANSLSMAFASDQVLPAGTNLIGKVGIDQTTGGTTNGVCVVPAQKASKLIARVVAAANNNAQTIVTGARQVFNVSVANKHATNWAVLKIYNKASTPTVGTDVPYFVLACPPASSMQFSDPDVGFAMGTGIAIGITTGLADTDNTSIAGAADAIIQIEYI